MDCLQGSKLAKHCSWSSRNSRAVQGLHKFKHHGKKVVQSSKSLLWFGYINTSCLSFCIFLNMSSFSEYVLRVDGAATWLKTISPSPCRCKRQGFDSMTWCHYHEWCWSAHAEGWKADLQLALWPGISSSKLFWCHKTTVACASMCFH